MSNTIKRLIHSFADDAPVHIYDEEGKCVVMTDKRHVPYHLLDVEYVSCGYDRDGRFERITIAGSVSDYKHCFIHTDYDDDPNRLRHELEVVKADAFDDYCRLHDEVIDLRTHEEMLMEDYKCLHEVLDDYIEDNNIAIAILKVALRDLDRGNAVDLRKLAHDVFVALDIDDKEV